MRHVSIIVTVVLACALLGPVARTETDAAGSIAVFFVRHAEKAEDDPRDPTLSATGAARADALARLLEPTGVTHLFASQYRRTRLTLEPLAGVIDREITTIRAQDVPAQIAALRELPSGSVAVVAGHSNTIPALICDLGGHPADLDCSANPQLPESDYGRLFLLLLPAQETLTLHYGN